MENYKLLLLTLIFWNVPLVGKEKVLNYSKVMVDRLEEVCERNHIVAGVNSMKKCSEFTYELKKDEKSYFNKYEKLCAENNKNACYLIAKAKLARKSKDSLDRFIHTECMDKNNLTACLEGQDDKHTYNKYLVRACQLDEFRSCYLIGEEALNNREYILAREFLEKACGGKDYRACFKLVRDVERESESARLVLYQKICDGKFERLCAAEGKTITIRFENHPNEDWCGHSAWANRDRRDFSTCDSIKYISCNAVVEEELLKGNLKKAGDLAKRGCDKNEANSCTLLGIVEGKKGNKKSSEEILNQACYKGFAQRACDLIPNYKDPHNYNPITR
ncbi:hypothetical protein SHI21_19420 [Bacteriovorax sp. PP10]|uniref:Beta-lactamase n=1 Tax=Bacteriovorax antarcticus TaxID=3088717 RepID=A0ABU5W2F0_9BACT|nr:hypothetical protein [Bacteriovorax sp. PP10]MEA9358415.1 hypothetical protein [Bacteriovorax sp. PP10]